MDSIPTTFSPATLESRRCAGHTQAVIDIGSNSVLLLVGRKNAQGQLEILRDESIVTRLSEGADSSGRLKSSAIDRTLVALHELRMQAQEHGARPTAFATEGVRMADNRNAFLVPAAEVLGEPVQMISGLREAELSYRSVTEELSDPHEEIRVLDIGGGSTELVVGQGQNIVESFSHEIGSVRMTERFVHHDPVNPVEIEAMERSIRELLAQQPLEPQPVLYGLAGTVTSVAALILGLRRYERERVDKVRLSYEQVRALREQLASETVAQRRKHDVLGRGRADVIVAGVTILSVAMQHCGASTLIVRDRGHRYALLADRL